MKIRELINGIRGMAKMISLPDTDGNGGTLEDVIKDAIKETIGEYVDDGKLTTAEIAEILGLVCGWLADIPAYSGWAGPLDLATDWLISYAIAHGEDGV